MRFLIVDDEPLVLEEIKIQLEEVSGICEIITCLTAKDAIIQAKCQHFDTVFLDIELGTANGIQLAKELKELQPMLHIIFVTAYSKYAIEAFSVHATGYLLKPIQTEQLKQELTFLYGSLPFCKQVRIQTFDGFEVFVDGCRLSFGRQKSKELLAYLVMRRGANVTIREACSILFEDRPYDRALKNYFHTILAHLKKTLSDAGAEDIIEKSFNRLSVAAEKLDCDYYRFLDGDAKVINAYHGEFMPCYSWAEFSVAALNDQKKELSEKMFSQ